MIQLDQEAADVQHPKYYNRPGAMECIEEMIRIFGIEETKIFAKLNVWKYRYRSADKGGMKDMQKSDEYMVIYKRLCDMERKENHAEKEENAQ